MECIPPEVLGRSFYLACTDGGKTANSLRLVSRTICAVANLHRFRTVAVSGIGAFKLLLNELAQVPAELCVIEHLLICDKPRDRACVDLAHTKLPGDHLAHSRIATNLRLREQQENEEEACEYMQLLPPFLAEIAPSLRSLSFVLFNPQHSMVLHHLATFFPHLEALSLRYPPWMKDADQLPPSLSMPVLRKLVINVDGTFLSARTRLVTQFGTQCLCLQHVVLQSLRTDYGIIDILRKAVSSRKSIEHKPLAFARFDIFPVLVQPIEPRLTEYANDDWIRIHLDANQAPKYQDYVCYWQDEVHELMS